MQKLVTSRTLSSAFKETVVLFATSALLVFGASAYAQENSLNAPEVLDLDDPFARGINRAADQASDGLALPDPNGQTMGASRVGKDLLGEANVRALSADLYRVAALAVTEGSARGQIFEASNQDVTEGSRPQIPYLRIGSFDSSANARQAAINLKNIMEDYIGGHFILRPTSGGIDLDIGPLHDVLHAENYCEIMLLMSNGIVSDCYAVLEYPGFEPLDTFTSTAMLRLAPTAIETVLTDTNDVFNLTESSQKLIQVKEGEILGNGQDQIVKITPSGLILVSDTGDITQLPLDYIPENPFQATQPAAPAQQPNLLTQPANN